MVADRDSAERDEGRGRKFIVALMILGTGVLLTAAGFALGLGRTGDAATAAGVVSGVGFSFILGGALLAWWNRSDGRAAAEAGQTRRDRLEAQRARQLVAFPAVALLFLALAVDSGRDILAGRSELRDYLSILLPVLYAWLSVAIVMGWDGQSRKNRRFLEDELTAVFRAKALTTGFLVLMTGATAALAVALVRPDLGVLALLAALSAAGAAAAIRFAWLDREAGRDG